MSLDGEEQLRRTIHQEEVRRTAEKQKQRAARILHAESLPALEAQPGRLVNFGDAAKARAVADVCESCGVLTILLQVMLDADGAGFLICSYCKAANPRERGRI